ncbi:MAG TPA: hypothetical protein VMG12_09050 [Polyangiaceae bacterium]|nr:hypothetical protein [Polyangiaceae bacterium]
MKKSFPLFFAALGVAAGLHAASAEAVTCKPNIPSPGGNVPQCGAAKGSISIIDGNSKVVYRIETTTGALVSGVPVLQDGVTPVPEHADTGGGTCNVVRANGSVGASEERTCKFKTLAQPAKKYFIQG